MTWPCLSNTHPDPVEPRLLALVVGRDLDGAGQQLLGNRRDRFVPGLDRRDGHGVHAVDAVARRTFVVRVAPRLPARPPTTPPARPTTSASAATSGQIQPDTLPLVGLGPTREPGSWTGHGVVTGPGSGVVAAAAAARRAARTGWSHPPPASGNGLSSRGRRRRVVGPAYGGVSPDSRRSGGSCGPIGRVCSRSGCSAGPFIVVGIVVRRVAHRPILNHAEADPLDGVGRVLVAVPDGTRAGRRRGDQTGDRVRGGP